MRNEIAEWMLSQVALPGQVRTIVGDLLEAQPGPVQFWRSVLQAAVSIASRDPRRFLVKLTGFVIQIGFWAFLAWAFTVSTNPARPLLAVYAVMVSLFLLWQAIVGFVIRQMHMRVRAILPWLLFVTAGYAAVAWTVGRSHKWGSSQLTTVEFWIRVVLLILLTSIPFGSWIRWQRERKNASPENDRPVAG